MINTKLFTKKFLFILILVSIAFFCIFINSSKAATSSAFNSWVEENKEELNKLFYGYDYVVLNNKYHNYCYICYTNAPNNKFYFGEDNKVNGDRRYLLSKSDLGDNYYGIFCVNPREDNNFVLPTTLTISQVTGDNRIVNNFSTSNILYSSSNIYDKNCSGVVFEKKTFPVLPVPTLQEVVVAELEKAQVMEQMKTTITGFLKYLIAFVISVIAFWKGWQFLLKNFKRA